MELTAEIIIEKVCYYYHLRIGDLQSKSRLAEYVRARHLSMFFIRKYTKLSLSQTGLLFERDHASVVFAVKSVYNQIETDRRYRKEFAEVGYAVLDSAFVPKRNTYQFAVTLNFRFYYFRKNRVFRVLPPVKIIVPVNIEPVKFEHQPKRVSPFAEVMSCNNQGYSGYREHQL